jgi:hypothetical protein
MKAVLKWGELLRQYFDQEKNYRNFIVMKNVKKY